MRVLALLTAALVALAPRAWAQSALPDLGSASDAELSPQMERRLGESIVRDIRRDPQFIETNPLLGRRPSNARVAVTCVAAGTAVWIVGDRLEGAARWAWLGAVFGLGVLNATHNWRELNSPGSEQPASLGARFAF